MDLFSPLALGALELPNRIVMAPLTRSRATLERGVYTASAGNMAQGVAWCARELGVPCHVVVPDHAPATKLAAIERLGAEVIREPFERWWRVLEEHRYAGLDGLFIHPVSDPAVIAGNGTIALEILEDLADVDSVLVPFGGGGLSSGIAAGVRALAPRTKVFACEVETAAPLAAALAAGAPQPSAYTPSFVDGIGGRGVLAEMWPLVSSLLDGSIVVTLAGIAGAIRLLAERQRVIAEGAGAASLAAALSGRAPASSPAATSTPRSSRPSSAAAYREASDSPLKHRAMSAKSRKTAAQYTMTLSVRTVTSSSGTADAAPSSVPILEQLRKRLTVRARASRWPIGRAEPVNAQIHPPSCAASFPVAGRRPGNGT